MTSHLYASFDDSDSDSDDIHTGSDGVENPPPDEDDEIRNSVHGMRSIAADEVQDDGGDGDGERTKWSSKASAIPGNGVSESEQRRRTIETELGDLLRRAETNEFQDGETFDEDAIEALQQAAHKICYRRKYYDAIRDEFVVFPTVVKSLLNYSLIEAAEEFYIEAAGGEEDEFPVAYTAILRATAEQVAAESGGGEGGQDDVEEIDEEYMNPFASTVHSRSVSHRASVERAPSPSAPSSTPSSPSPSRKSTLSDGDSIPKDSTRSQESFYGDANETIDQLDVFKQEPELRPDDPMLLGPLSGDRDGDDESDDDELLFFEAVEDADGGDRRSPIKANNLERSASPENQLGADERVTECSQGIIGVENKFEEDVDKHVEEEENSSRNEGEGNVLEPEQHEPTRTAFGEIDQGIGTGGLKMSKSEGQESESPVRASKNKMRVVVLASNKEQANQERAVFILRAEGIEPDVVDAVGNPVLRNELFAISGIRGNYPQVFLMDPIDGETVFLGGSDTIQRLHDAGNLKASILSGSPIETLGEGNRMEGISSHSFALPNPSEGLGDDKIHDDLIEEKSFNIPVTANPTPASENDDSTDVDASEDVKPKVVTVSEIEQVKVSAKESIAAVAHFPAPFSMDLVDEEICGEDIGSNSNSTSGPVAIADMPSEQLEGPAELRSEHNAGMGLSESHSGPMLISTREGDRHLVVNSDEAEVNAIDSSFVSEAPIALSVAAGTTENLPQPVSVLDEFPNVTAASIRSSKTIDATRKTANVAASGSTIVDAREDWAPESLNVISMPAPLPNSSTVDLGSSNPLHPHRLVAKASENDTYQNERKTDDPVVDESKPVSVVAPDDTKVETKVASYGSVQRPKSSSNNSLNMRVGSRSIPNEKTPKGISPIRPHPLGLGVLDKIDAREMNTEVTRSEQRHADMSEHAAVSEGAIFIKELSFQESKPHAILDPHKTPTKEQATPQKSRSDPFEPIDRTHDVWEPVEHPLRIESTKIYNPEATEQGRRAYETPLKSPPTPPLRLSADDELELARLEALLQIPPSPRQPPRSVSSESHESDHLKNPELGRLEDLLLNSPPPRVPERSVPPQRNAPESRSRQEGESIDPSPPSPSPFQSYLPPSLTATSGLGGIENESLISLQDVTSATSESSDQRSLSQDGEDGINDDYISGIAASHSSSSDDDLGVDYERLVADAKKQLEQLENEMRELREISKTYESDEEVSRDHGVGLYESSEGTPYVDEGSANDDAEVESYISNQEKESKKKNEERLVKTQVRGLEPPSAEDVQKARPNGEQELSKKRTSEKEKRTSNKRSDRRGKKKQVHAQDGVKKRTSKNEKTERRSNRSFTVSDGDLGPTLDDRAVTGASGTAVDPDGYDGGLIKVSDPPSLVVGVNEEFAADTDDEYEYEQRQKTGLSSNKTRKKRDKNRRKRISDGDHATGSSTSAGRDYVEYEAKLRADDNNTEKYTFRNEVGIEHEEYFETNEVEEDASKKACQRGIPVEESASMERGSAKIDDQVSVINEDIDLQSIDKADSVPRNLDLEAAERRRQKDEAWDEIPCNWCCRNLPHTWVIATTMVYRLDRATKKERGTVQSSSPPS